MALIEEPFLENPPKRRAKRAKRAKKSRKNGPELVIYGLAGGNPRRRKTRRKPKMAKRSRRKSRKNSRRRVRRNSWFNDHKRHVAAGRKGSRRRKSNPVRRVVRRHRRRRHNPIRRAKHRRHVRRNPISSLTRGLFQLPSMQQVIWAGAGGIFLPTISQKLLSFVPVDALKGGYGNITAEFIISSLAAGMARKYMGQTAGDVLFVLTLARTVGRIVNQINPAWGTAAPTLTYYNPLLSYSGALPGFSGNGVARPQGDVMPSMTGE